MMKRKSNFISQNRNNYYDADIYDLIDLKESGLSDMEIAKELGVAESYVKKIIHEIERDY